MIYWIDYPDRIPRKASWFLFRSGWSKRDTLMSAMPSLQRIGWKWLQQIFALCLQTSGASRIRAEGARRTNHDHAEEIGFKRLSVFVSCAERRP